MKEIQLFFEFKDKSGEVNPLLFHNAEEIIIARRVEEVKPCLEKVQSFVEAGFYAAGFLSYEAAPAFDPAFVVNQDYKMPLLWFGIFQRPSGSLVRQGYPYTVTEWIPQTSFEEYESQIEKIKQYIEVGDTYQVNYTIRLGAHFEGDDFEYYRQLSKGQSSDYCAYISTGEHRILSASPELFFHLEGGVLTTRPMKGTIRRGKTSSEDERNYHWLAASEKNQAENLMIVDLLRNDLGQLAEVGSVQVPSLFTIESYPTVYQMTSTITAKLAPNKGISDIFSALFPCGSITGAPKISTMNIIHELESSPREVYCGAIGYITPEMEAVFNVPIRTVVIENSTGQAQYGVGGGITWDSTVSDEYEEIQTKTRFLKEASPKFSLLESLLLQREGYFLLEEHLERIKKSAAYFGVSVKEEEIIGELRTYRENGANQVEKVRLLVNEKGVITVEGAKLNAVPEVITACLTNTPVSKEDIFLYHKTTNRQIYEKAKASFPDVYDVLLWNEEGELTEFTTGNLVVEREGEFLTPYENSGLLPGTFRSHLLKENKIKEARLLLRDLENASSIWLINSVRKWVRVQLVGNKLECS